MQSVARNIQGEFPVDVEAERRLLQRALGGDGRAFAELVEPHLDRCFRLAVRTCGDRALGEEAVQEALTLAHRDLARYEPGTSLRGWLCALAMRSASTLARSERRRAARELTSAPPEGLHSAEAILQAREQSRRIELALAGLSEKRREAALLRFDGGLSSREIAEVMGISDAAVRQLLSEATKVLRTVLAAAGR